MFISDLNMPNAYRTFLKSHINYILCHMHFHVFLEASFFFYLRFVSRTFTNHRTAREGGGHFINSSLPLLTASQALRTQPGDYCRGLAHRCTYLAAGIELGTFGFSAQVANTKLRVLGSFFVIDIVLVFFFVNFEHISQLFLVFLLTFNKKLNASQEK